MWGITAKFLKQFASVTCEVIKMKGVLFVVKSWMTILFGALLQYVGIPQLVIWRRLRCNRTFRLGNKTYRYFYHRHNTTWRNERAVEIPIIQEWLTQYRGRRILEVGNVLSHYFEVDHDVVDRYERGKNVINTDVTEFNTNKKYDLIISISTLEHIGWFWYEEPRNYGKVLVAIEKLRSMLAEGGKMVVTIPVGYNFKLDELIDRGEIKFTQMYCMKRISRDNRWVEVSWDEVKHMEYDTPYPGANGLVIGVIEK